MTTRELLRRLRPGLEDLGFRGAGPYPAAFPQGEAWTGVLGLNAATKYTSTGTALIMPIVGIIHHPTEAFIWQLLNENPSKRPVATISRNLGDLEIPRRFRQWLIGGPDDQSAELLEAVGSKGLAYMRSISTVRDLLEEALGGWSVRKEYVVPAVLYQAGDQEQGLARIQATIDSMGERTDLAAQRFRNFGAAYSGLASA